MKFLNLFKKEITGLLNMQFIVPLVLIFVVFSSLGGAMGNITEEIISNAGDINILDLDKTEFSGQLLEYLGNSYNVKEQTPTIDDVTDRAALLNDLEIKNLLIIPAGFSQKITEEHTAANIETVSKITGTAALSNISGEVASGAVGIINSYISAFLMQQGGIENSDIAFIENPIVTAESTVVFDKWQNVSLSSVMSFISQQGVIVPIAVFILIMFTSQMIITSMSTEKIDKTLETLLSSPVSRMSIIWSKMLAATILAIISAAVYMMSFNSFMGGVMDTAMSTEIQGAVGDTLTLSDVYQNLGITITVGNYILIGLQMLMTILIALCVSLMLGALINDPKSASVVVMPVMICSLIPYIISILIDVNTLPMIAKVILYIIPFTHTFLAMNNIIFGDWVMFWGGLAYQFVFFLVVLFFTQRLFMSDKILTISLNFGQKKKFKKTVAEE